MENTIDSCKRQRGRVVFALIMKLKDVLAQQVFPNDYISLNFADAVALYFVSTLSDVPAEVVEKTGELAIQNLTIYNKLKSGVRKSMGDTALCRTLSSAIALSRGDSLEEIELVTVQCALALGIIGPLFIEKGTNDIGQIDLPDNKL